MVLHEQLGLGASRAEPGEQRQHLLEVAPEEPSADRRARPRDFKDQEAPSRLQDPPAFPEGHAEVGHVAKGIAHAQEIEVVILERQRLHGPLHQRNGEGLPRFLQHAAARVEPDHGAGLTENA